MFLQRNQTQSILRALNNYPVTAIIGPRQCGKSTLAQELLKRFDKTLFLDLELPSDLLKIENAEWFFESNRDKLICIDEIQREAHLFPLIRSLVDRWGGNSHFLLLGSASRDLIQESSETLAGRISYQTLTPFLFDEIKNQTSFNTYLTKGGFPRSILNVDNETSFEWRENFISTFLERDLIQWKGFTPKTMRRLWQMLAHYNGQTVDYSRLAKSLEVSSPTIKTYIDLLASTFMVEVLSPYTSNLGKRLVKSPKIYISDSGILTALLGLSDFNQIIGHPSFGALWEQIVLTQLKGHFPKADFFHYRTSNGNEVDIIMVYRNMKFIIECKATSSPKVSKGFYYCIEAIKPNYTYIASFVKEGWSINESTEIVNLNELIKKISSKISI